MSNRIFINRLYNPVPSDRGGDHMGEDERIRIETLGCKSRFTGQSYEDRNGISDEPYEENLQDKEFQERPKRPERKEFLDLI